MLGWGQTKEREQKGKEGWPKKIECPEGRKDGGPEGFLIKPYSAVTSWDLVTLHLVAHTY